MTGKGQEEMSKKADDLQCAFRDGRELREDDFEEIQDLTGNAERHCNVEELSKKRRFKYRLAGILKAGRFCLVNQELCVIL